MGAHFQALRATPGQRQMEMLSWVDQWAVRSPFQKIIKVCDSGIGIIWVQVSRLLMPHPNKDRWKCTMFTNNFYVSVSLTRSRRYVQGK